MYDTGELYFDLNTAGNHFIWRQAGQVERMRLDSNGNLGIGTASPGEKLEVLGNISINNTNFYKAKSLTGTAYSLAGITSGNVIQIGAIDYTTAGTIFAGGDNSKFTTGGAAGTTRMTIANGGNIGIGTASPNYALEINNNTKGLNVSNNLFVNGSSVGIGVVNPSQALEINGSLKLMNGSTNSFIYLPRGSAPSIYTYLTHGQIGTVGSDGLSIYSNSVIRANFHDTGYITLTPATYFAVNTSAIYLNATVGNVGLGTTTPTQKLDVRGDIISTNGNGNVTIEGNSNSPAIAINRLGTNNYGQIRFQTANVNKWITGLADSDIAGDGSEFFIGQSLGGGSPSIWLETSGNVGIGTTTPSNKLDVRGVINASGDIYFNNGTAVGSGNLSGGGTAGYIPQWASGSTLNNSNIFQGSGGQIGINISAPVYTLHVKGGAFVDTLTNTLPFIVARSYKSSNWEEIRIGVDDAIGTFHYMNDETANRIIFRMNNTDLESGGGASANVNDVLTIAGDLAGGKVGIRNSAPLYSLDVVGNFSTSLGAFLATSSGNVGIGTTSPTQKLHVSGGVNISSGTPNLYLWDTDSSAISTMLVTDTNIFRIQDSSTLTNIFNVNLSSGFVGIGTTTPSNKLDVRGDINASGNIYFNNGTLVGLGNLSGGGTAGYLAQWSGTSGLNNSPIYTTGGNVGIGTTTPSSQLQLNYIIGGGEANQLVFSLNSSVDNIFSIQKDGDTTTSGNVQIGSGKSFQWGGANTQITGVASGDITFHTLNGGERMRISSTGVGIGIPAPSSMLHVNITSASSVNIANNSNSLFFVNGTTGNVGIGTTNATQKLDVRGNINTTGNITMWDGNQSFSVRGDGGALTEQFGYNARAIATSSTALGNASLANGSSTLAIGYGATAYGINSVAIGKGALTTNQAAVAVGQSSNAVIFGVALGSAANSSDNGAIAIGQNASATGARSIAIGENSRATAQGQLVIGAYRPSFYVS